MENVLSYISGSQRRIGDTAADAQGVLNELLKSDQQIYYMLVTVKTYLYKKGSVNGVFNVTNLSASDMQLWYQWKAQSTLLYNRQSDIAAHTEWAQGYDDAWQQYVAGAPAIGLAPIYIAGIIVSALLITAWAITDIIRVRDASNNQRTNVAGLVDLIKTNPEVASSVIPLLQSTLANTGGKSTFGEIGDILKWGTLLYLLFQGSKLLPKPKGR